MKNGRQVSAAPPKKPAKAARQRIVSAPRSNGPKKGVNFKMPTDDLAELDAVALQQHRSRSELILLGLRHCVDGPWKHAPDLKPQAGAHAPQASQIQSDTSPSKALVDLSQSLMGAVWALELICAGRRRSKRRMKDAASALADVKTTLSMMIEDLG